MESDVTETDVSLKDRREAKWVSGVPLASQQGQPTSLIADEHFVWTLIRLLVSRDDGETTAPTWNEFHEILSGNEAPKPRTIIGNSPLFPQSPTDPAVAQASLDYFMLLKRKLGQDATVVTADQAIYDIVKGNQILPFTTKKSFSVMLLLILLDFINITVCTLLIVSN